MACDNVMKHLYSVCPVNAVNISLFSQWGHLYDVADLWPFDKSSVIEDNSIQISRGY